MWALRSLAAGFATGALPCRSLVADEALAPALGFSPPNRALPAVSHVRGILSQLA